MEVFGRQYIGVEIGLAGGGLDKPCEAHAETAYQYHPQSYSMEHAKHGSSEHHAEDDRDPALCKYAYAVTRMRLDCSDFGVSNRLDLASERGQQLRDVRPGHFSHAAVGRGGPS
jgi:hypothetical protein